MDHFLGFGVDFPQGEVEVVELPDETAHEVVVGLGVFEEGLAQGCLRGFGGEDVEVSGIDHRIIAAVEESGDEAVREGASELGPLLSIDGDIGGRDDDPDGSGGSGIEILAIKQGFRRQ